MTDNSESQFNDSTPPNPLPKEETSSEPMYRSLTEKLRGRTVNISIGATILWVGIGFVILILGVAVGIMIRSYTLKNQALPAEEPQSVLVPAEMATVSPTTDTSDSDGGINSEFAINRLAQGHTDLPNEPRTEIIEYIIVSGDTIMGIAEKFGLKPQSILLSNYEIFGDDPRNIFPGDTILIPPIDGAVHLWNTGDGLNGISSFYNVSPDAIIDWPANKLNRATLGDLSMPNIPAGTLLFIPGGEREFMEWLPDNKRNKPAQSSISGSACGIVTEGYIGNGSFIWPTTETHLSGYDYNPETSHRGIDIDGSIGNPVWAVDAGVIVYSNWNYDGYGNLIVIDHGNGWQSVYAQLDTFMKYCGQSVEQGEQIGTVGETGYTSGPHLHFELRHEDYGIVNPWDFLQQ